MQNKGPKKGKIVTLRARLARGRKQRPRARRARRVTIFPFLGPYFAFFAYFFTKLRQNCKIRAPKKEK